MQADIRKIRSRPDGSDNADGSRQDMQSNASRPVAQSGLELKRRLESRRLRALYGDVLLLLHPLEPSANVDAALRRLEVSYLYLGYDCTQRWAAYLGDVTRTGHRTIGGLLNDGVNAVSRCDNPNPNPNPNWVRQPTTIFLSRLS